MGVQYGDFLWCRSGEIEEVKPALLEQMIQTIKQLAENEKFWIVKTKEDFESEPVLDFGCPKELQDDFASVGWKVAFPQLLPVQDYKMRMQEEYWELKRRYNKLHEMCIKYEAGTLDFTPTCSLELLTKQKAAMGQYLHCLEVRAQIEGVRL